MYYLDANAFVYPALYDGEKAQGATRLLRRVVDGEVNGATAALTVDEVVYVLSREVDHETAIDQGRRLLALPNLGILKVDGLEILRALNAMEAVRDLAPRDAIHYGVMATNGIHTIVTDDSDFDALSDIDRRLLETLDEIG